MNDFLKIAIACCVFVLLFSVMTIANPDNDALNWTMSTLCGMAISIGLVTSDMKPKK